MREIYYQQIPWYGDNIQCKKANILTDNFQNNTKDELQKELHKRYKTIGLRREDVIVTVAKQANRKYLVNGFIKENSEYASEFFAHRRFNYKNNTIMVRGGEQVEKA